MKTKAKKISFSILSVFAVVILLMCAVLLTGCNNSKTSSITLTEAKELILNALATEDDSTNIDILTKFGTSKVSLAFTMSTQSTNDEYQSYDMYLETNVELNIEKSGENYIKYDLSGNSATKEAMSSGGENAYIYEGSTFSEYSPDMINVYSRYVEGISTDYSDANFNSFLNMGVEYFSSFFTESSFDSVYTDTITKTTLSNGYSIELSIIDDLSEILRLFDLETTEEDSSLSQTWNLTATINFNNNNEITSVEFTFTGNATNDYMTVSCEYNFIFELSDSEITQPDWVTDYLEQLNSNQ